MAGKICRLLHPNQVKRHFESVVTGQMAVLNNAAASQRQEITAQTNILLSQIEELRAQNLQAIEDSYIAASEQAVSEFTQLKSEHEEFLAHLSFFMLYGKAAINTKLDARLVEEKQRQLLNLGTNYKNAVAAETARFSLCITAQEAELQAINAYRAEETAKLNAFMDEQIKTVEEQYVVDINAIEAELNRLRNEVNTAFNTQVKELKAQRKTMATNGAIVFGAAAVAYIAPTLLVTAVGHATASTVAVSAITTGLGATSNLLNGSNEVSLNVTFNAPNYNAKPYTPQPKPAPALYLPKGNSLSDNYQSSASEQVTSYSSYNNYTAQQNVTINYANAEQPYTQQKHIAAAPTPPVVENKTSALNWSNMAMRSACNDNSPEVMSWKQNNSANYPGLSTFFNSIAQSKAQRTVNAFSNAFIDSFVVQPIKVIKQITTKEFVEQTKRSAQHAKDFVVADTQRFIDGEVTETGLFFAQIGNFLDDDFDRLCDGQPTVIGTAIEQDFKALVAMSSEELAAHLGHEAGDTLLLLIGGRAAVKAADTVTQVGRNFVATHKFQSPLVFQFEQGKLYSGFPFDELKLQNPIERKIAIKDVIVNDIIQAEYLRRSLELQKVFTLDGKLAANVLEKATPINSVFNFHKDAPAYKQLTPKGNLEQWHKYYYRFELNIQHNVNDKLMLFKGEVHFYMNEITKEVYYDLDYKIKLQLPNQPVVKVEELFTEVFKGVNLKP